jgi:IS1 family transposase
MANDYEEVKRGKNIGHAQVKGTGVYTTAYCAVIFKQSTGARNREGKDLSHRLARLHRLA